MESSASLIMIMTIRHFRSGTFVLYSEAVLWWEVNFLYASTIAISIGAIAMQCSLYNGCPLVGGAIIGGSTVDELACSKCSMYLLTSMLCK